METYETAFKKWLELKKRNEEEMARLSAEINRERNRIWEKKANGGFK